MTVSSYPKAEWVDRQGRRVRYSGGLDAAVFHFLPLQSLPVDRFSEHSALPDSYIVKIDSRGDILRANGRFSALLGLTYDRVISLNFFDLTHPDDAERERLVFDRLARLDQPDFPADATSCAYEKRLYLGTSEAAHYDNIFHVSCLIARPPGETDGSFLAVMQENNIFRHFRNPPGP